MSPMAEAPPRLATQFIKFAQGLALHYESETLADQRIDRLMRRVALHTIDVITASVIHVLYCTQSTGGVDATAINILLKKYSRDTIRDVLLRLSRIGFVEMNKHDATFMYRLTDRVCILLTETKLFHDLPSSDTHYRSDIQPVADMPKRRPVLTIKRKS